MPPTSRDNLRRPKKSKGTSIRAAKREEVLSALVAGKSDREIARSLKVSVDAVAGVRVSDDGQRALTRVAEVGEATREEMLRVAGSVMIKGLRRLDETIEHIDPGDVPAALGPSLKMLFAQKHEHTGANGEDLFQKYRQMPLEQLREEMRKRLAEPKAQDDNMPDE